MLLSLNGRRVYFDLAGPQNAPVVCFTHSLNSDSGMWVEQMVPLLGAGYRVLRLDMRGHGGSAHTKLLFDGFHQVVEFHDRHAVERGQKCVFVK